MAVELFHVSTKVYPVGHVVAVPAGGQTEFHGRLTAKGHHAAEGPLEAARPPAAQSRLSTQYAFETVDDCWVYGTSEYKNQALHYYRVSMEDPTKVPMAMVDAVRAAAETNGVTPEQLSTLIGEYWSPTQKWCVYEYLAGSMTILEEVAAPNGNSMEAMAAIGGSDNDHILAKKLRTLVLSGHPIPPPPAEENEEEEEEQP